MEAIPEEPGAGGEMPSPEPALVTAAERNEIFRLVAASAVIGVISNFIWGGLFDTEGATGALLGGVLFAGWGMAESCGVLVVKWLGMPGGRPGLVAGGAFIGGAYVGLTQAAGTLVTVKGGAEVIVVSIISLVAGFVVGALISAFCTLKLSRIVAAGGVEPASPAPPVPPGASAGPAPE